MNRRLKKTIQLLANALALAIAFGFLSANTCECSPISLYLGSGFSIPNGDNTIAGYYGEAKAGLKIDTRTELLIGADFHNFGINKNKFPAVNGSLRTILVGFDFKMDMVTPTSKEPLVPFLIIGGGYANTDLTDALTALPGANSFSVNSESHRYFEFGGGFKFGQLFALFRMIGAGDSFFSAGIGIKVF